MIRGVSTDLSERPGGSSFEVTRFGEDAGEAAPAILSQSVMLVAFRHEPECASPLPLSRR